MAEIGRDELRELLVRCWMTHDAMWFATALEKTDIETANRLNLGAIRGLAPIEIGRVKKALGIETVASSAELRTFLEGMMGLVGGDFMDFTWDWRPGGTLRVDVGRCFAHDGIERMGAIEGYACGIFERIAGWFAVLGVTYEMTPSSRRCMLHYEGQCFREFRFDWAEQSA